MQVNNDKVRVNKDNTKLKADNYLKNINEISEIINDLHDDPQLRHIELDRINALLVEIGKIIK